MPSSSRLNRDAQMPGLQRQGRKLYQGAATREPRCHPAPDRTHSGNGAGTEISYPGVQFLSTSSVTASLLQDTLKSVGPASWFCKQWPLAGSYGLLEAEPKVFHTPVDALPVLQFLLGCQGLPPSQQVPQALMAGVGGKQGSSCSGFDLGGCVPVTM